MLIGSGEYPLSKRPHKGSNKGTSWARRHIYIPDAVQRGAVAVIAERSFPELKIPYLDTKYLLLHDLFSN